MYVVIQKIMRKRPNKYGAYKELNTSFFTYTANGVPYTKYKFNYAGGRFDRPILDAYKISIHESKRINGKVHKQQWNICTMDYYSLVNSWPGDHIRSSRLQKKLEQMGITEEQLWDMVYVKLQPIIDQVKAEFEQSEEYQTSQRHRNIIRQYDEKKKEFEEKYGSDTYDYCYDVYGVLRDEIHLRALEMQYKAQQEYQQRSYYQHSQSNYNNYDYSSSYQPTTLQYLESDKPMLKKIIRTLTKTYHPDVGGDPEIMKMVTRLKDEWGV